jgi:hypothetical protein
MQILLRSMSFEILRAVAYVWDITTCSLVDVCQIYQITRRYIPEYSNLLLWSV